MKKINVWKKTEIEADCRACLHLSKQGDLYICKMGAYDVDVSATLFFDKECESYELNHEEYLEDVCINAQR